jgi:glycosyltransferase involved in cell wall biosynthesis
MSTPLISVVMPVYDAGEYLVDAVASIVEQTLDDWELIAVDDGSQDGSGEILEWFALQDARIRVIGQANAGIVAALNRGCAAARGPLIARMDADDVAFPQRLARQAEFMRRHPECVVVGSSILEMDAESDPLGRSWLPTEHAEILDNLLNRRTGHFHPTTMYRAGSLRGGRWVSPAISMDRGS